MKFVIVGTNHAGIAAANTLLDNYGKNNEVIMIDRNNNLCLLYTSDAADELTRV